MKNPVAPSKALSCLTLLVLALSDPAQAQFTYTTNDGAITITGYTGGAAAVTIPDTIEGYPVTTIGTDAFKFNGQLSSITLPSSLTSIEIGAFSSTGLKEIVIPDGTTNIGSGVFLNSALINITLPASVVSIGSDTFNSTHVTNVILPSNLASISDGLFGNCLSLQSVSIPSSVTSIGSYAFGTCFNLLGISIPNSVANIGDAAFIDNHSLTNVYLPASVLNLGAQVFKTCGSLKAINVDPLNPVYSSRDGVLFDKAQTALLTFPPGRTGRYRIPDGVTTIGFEAFFFGGEFQFPSLTNIIVPGSVTNIGAYAFSRCPDLTTVFFLGNAPVQRGSAIFDRSDAATIYYLPGTAGWSGRPPFARPLMLWNPTVLPGSISLPTNPFNFTITGTANIPVVIEASTNLLGGWEVVQSLRVTNGAVTFSDPQAGSHRQRFYRLGAP